jgi:antitoxin VapB
VTIRIRPQAQADVDAIAAYLDELGLGTRRWSVRARNGIYRSRRRAVMARTARSDTPPNARAKIFTNGRSQAVRLPREFRFEGKEVAIRKEGEAVILEPVAKRKWPSGYWQRIDRRAKDLDLGRVVPIGGHLLDLGADDV